MGEWREVPFYEAFSVNPKVNIKRNDLLDFVDMQSLDANSRDVVASVKKEFAGSGSRFEHGDTLFARITPCLENGKIAQYKSLTSNKEAFGSTEFIVIRGRKDYSTNDFAYYFSKWDVFRNFAISQMTGSSGRQRVPVDSLNKFIINLPDIATQKKIASILSSLDDKIELNRKMNETLEEMARAIFKSWFVDFDPVHAKARGEKPAGMPDEIANLFPSEFVHSDQLNKPIPKGWEVKPLDEIADFLNGLALQKFPPKSEIDKLPVIKIAQLRKGDSSNSDFASRTIDEKYIIRDGDVIFSWSGSLLVKIWCGGEGALNQHLFKVTSEKYSKWLYFLWCSHHLMEFQHIASTKATTMGHIQRKHLSQAMCVIPDKRTLEHTESLLSDFIEKIICGENENKNLTQLRDSLLPKLISGEIEV